jgi:hypothetical protein
LSTFFFSIPNVSNPIDSFISKQFCKNKAF